MSDEQLERSLMGKTDAFLAEFFEKGESLVRELISENERLRSALNDEQSEVAVTDTAPSDTTVSLLMRRVATLEAECDEIRRLAGNVERESAPFRRRLSELEQEHYNLACMYVAGMQFQTATAMDEVVRTITELVLNFLGVGEFTLFGVDEETNELFPLMREGGPLEDVQSSTLTDDGPYAELMALRRPWRSGDPTFKIGDEVMNLPLVSGTRLVGIARLEGFLSQKSGFVDADESLLALISEHGGIGIESAWIRAHADEAPVARTSLERLMRP